MLHFALLRQGLLTLHFIGLAFGLGGAAIADFSFLKAVKMGDRITPETVAWMRSISHIVWIGIALLSVSGIGLFVLQPSLYLASVGFLAKMLFVAILVINGLFLNFYTTARLTTFNFSEIYTRRDAAWKARKLSFVFGAISAVTWYATLLTAQFKSVVRLSLIGYILIYLLALSFAIATALLIEHLLHSRHRTTPRTIDQLTTTTPTLSTPQQPSPLNPPVPFSSNQPIPLANAHQLVDVPAKPITGVSGRQADSFQQSTSPNVPPANAGPV